MRTRLIASGLALVVLAGIGWGLIGSARSGDSTQPLERTIGARKPGSSDQAIAQMDGTNAEHSQKSDPMALVSGTSAVTRIARAPSAAAAVDRLRMMPPSKDVADALAAVAIACGESQRWASTHAMDEPTVEGRGRQHREQVRQFLGWCGDVDEIRTAHKEAVAQARSSPAGTSDQDRAAALFERDGSLAPARESEALDLLFETSSIAVADGLATGLYSLAVPPVKHPIPELNEMQVVYLASAMIYCRRAELCAPGHPQTMLDCFHARLCAPGQSLIDYRYAVANRFEREMAERLVADWAQRRPRPGGG